VLLEVPQVTGLISALAKESIETRGLTLGDPVTQVSAAAEGTVLDQNPRAGEKLGVGGKVVLTIAGAVAVPSVINQTLTQAKAALDQLGLALEIRNRPLSDRPLDTVLDQAPKPPAKVPRGAVIQLDVSTGVPVPAVHGIDRASAKQQIEAAQLKFAEARSVPSDRPAGTVLELSPDQGVVVPLNTTVNVTVAVGVEVPDVVRAVLVNGRKTLETAGFQVQVTGDPDSDAIVQSQDPPAHKFIPLGAMVAVVSALENLVTVPGLIGQREAAAKDLCTRAALQMNVISRGISSEPEGAVFSQDPEAAKKVRRNSVVSVRVSTGQLTPPRRPPIDVHLPDPLPRPPVVSPRLPPVVIGRLGISALGVAQVEVPNVTGKGLTQAQQELDARGLKHSVTRVRHALAPDTVVDQTPRANDSAPRNSQVALVVSNGPL